MSFSNNFSGFPKVIIFYGPPASGKGTQAALLAPYLPGYRHLDFGSALREFVSDCLGNYFDEAEIDQTLLENPNFVIAKRIKDAMKACVPVETDDLRFVVESFITEAVDKGHGLIIEGPGRKREEAVWLSEFFNQKQLSVAIFHLHLSLSETVKRSVNRHYVEGLEQPFKSYQEAKAMCKEGQEPYRRPEDLDSHRISQRYELLYMDIYAEIVSIYQRNCTAPVFTVDSSGSIPEVSSVIADYFRIFYAFKMNTATNL